MVKKKTKSKAKKGAWFVAVRGSYLPTSWQAWLSYIPFVAYLVFTLVAGCRDATTTSTALLFIVPNWIAATAVMTWIAKRTS